MPKKVNLTVTITLPDDHGGGRLSIDPEGNVKFIDNDGNEVIPETVERATHYERPKGPKFQSKTSATGIQATVSGLEELAALDSFIVVDTNSLEIDETKVSAAFFIVCKLVKLKEGYSLQSLDNCGHVYEFHNVLENPELLSIFRIANDTVKTREIPNNIFVGIVTDTELDKHQEYSSGTTPIYLNEKLPSGFKLLYASSDSGQELLNALIKFCDKESSKYLRKMQSSGLKREGLGELTEDRSIPYRYTYYPDLSISDSVIIGASIGPVTKYSIQLDGKKP